MRTYTTCPEPALFNRAAHIIKDDQGWHVFDREEELRDTVNTPKRFRDVFTEVERVRSERGG